MINPTKAGDDDLPLPLATAARSIGVAPVSVFRWGKIGLKLGDERIFLELFRRGGRWTVRPSALAAFLERLNQRDQQAAAPAPRTTAARSRAAEAAERELDALGI